MVRRHAVLLVEVRVGHGVVGVVNDITAGQPGAHPAVRAHRHDHVVTQNEHGHVRAGRDGWRDDHIGHVLQVLPAPLVVLTRRDEDHVHVLLAHPVRGLLQVGHGGHLSPVGVSHHVLQADVDADLLRLLAPRWGHLLQQVHASLLHRGQKRQLPANLVLHVPEVPPRVYVVVDVSVSRREVFHVDVIGPHLRHGDFDVVASVAIGQLRHVEEVSEYRCCREPSRPVVHASDAQQGGVVKHLVAEPAAKVTRHVILFGTAGFQVRSRPVGDLNGTGADVAAADFLRRQEGFGTAVFPGRVRHLRHLNGVGIFAAGHALRKQNVFRESPVSQ